jgi:hypothetical protein
MALMSGALEVRMRWEHECLAAQAGLLGFSLCLSPTTHRETQHTW